MQFSAALVALASMAVFVAADLHFNAICINTDLGFDVYNHDATVASCEAYLARTGGKKQWETCPDCVMVKENYMCNSADKHIGGKEFTQYCREAGAHNAKSS